jgi:flagellar FliL protein
MAEDEEEGFADGEESADDGATPARRGRFGARFSGIFNRKKLIIFIILPIVLVVGALAGAYFSGLADPLLHMAKKEKNPADEIPKEGQPPAYYDLPEILVNLNTEGPGQHYLKIQVSLELQGPLDVARIEAMKPRIIDSFQVHLRELRVQDLQGSSGFARLREEFLTRATNVAKNAKIKDVYFKEILIQ